MTYTWSFHLVKMAQKRGDSEYQANWVGEEGGLGLPVETVARDLAWGTPP